MNRWQADGLLLLVVVIWGSTFIIVKNALDVVGPFVFVAARFWIAGLALLVLWGALRLRASWKALAHGTLAGLLLWGGYVTQTIGLQSTTASKAAFITGLAVVLVPLFAALLLRDRISRPVMLGVGLAALGMGLLTLSGPLEQPSRGDMWVMACAVCFAFHIIAVAHYAPQHNVLPFVVIQLLVTALLATGVALLLERDALLPPVSSHAAIWFMGLIGTALAFGLQVWGQRYTTATHAALIFALEPVFAALFAVGLGNEIMSEREWFGAALILIGMLGAELGPLLPGRRRAPRVG